jgi:hypothetical protein
LLLLSLFPRAQHHTFPNAFHSKLEGFEKQRHRDRLKMTLCFQHCVTLIVVPASVTRLGIKDYLTRELIRLGFLGTQPTEDDIKGGEKQCSPVEPAAIAVSSVVPDKCELQHADSVGIEQSIV